MIKEDTPCKNCILLCICKNRLEKFRSIQMELYNRPSRLKELQQTMIQMGVETTDEEILKYLSTKEMITTCSLIYKIRDVYLYSNLNDDNAFIKYYKIMISIYEYINGKDQ